MLECKSTESAESKTINGLSLGSLHKALEDGKLNLNRLELGLAMAPLLRQNATKMKWLDLRYNIHRESSRFALE